MASDASFQDSEALRSVFDAVLPLLLDTLDFLEPLHLHAVELQKQGQTAKAHDLFHLVRDHAGRFPALKAWAGFKDAEIHRHAGEEAEAREAFAHVLECNPGHVKTRLLLAPAQEPFRVMVGDRPGWPHPVPFIPFPLENQELWHYYLGHRLVDQLWITPPRRLFEWDPEGMAAVFRQHLAPDATLVLAMDNGRHVQLGSGIVREALASGRTALLAALEPYCRSLLA